MKKILPLIFIVTFCFCKSKFIENSRFEYVRMPEIYEKKGKLTSTLWKNWQHKDPFKDTIAGISLERAYDELKLENGDTIVVALIDGRLDLDNIETKKFR